MRKDYALAPLGPRLIVSKFLQPRRDVLPTRFEEASNEREPFFVRRTIARAPIEHGGAKRLLRERIRDALRAELRVGGRELGFTRYDLMFGAIGCHAEYVEEPGLIRPALERAAASGNPAVVNVVTDPAARAQTVRFADYST